MLGRGADAVNTESLQHHMPPGFASWIVCVESDELTARLLSPPPLRRMGFVMIGPLHWMLDLHCVIKLCATKHDFVTV